jgi:catechol 2,3-dioxygenase-like lactoylglutathione lyase family enzyme
MQPPSDPSLQVALEAVPLPVADVERAKAFYTDRLGWSLDVDYIAGPEFRVVQVTPPGSACSILFGVGIVDTAPGSVRGLHLVTRDVVAVQADLVRRGVDVSPVRHMTDAGWADGVDPAHTDFNSFAHFADPDGNTWEVQDRGHSG